MDVIVNKCHFLLSFLFKSFQSFLTPFRVLKSNFFIIKVPSDLLICQRFLIQRFLMLQSSLFYHFPLIFHTRFSLKTGFFTKQKTNHIKQRFWHLLSAIRILNFTCLAQKTASTSTNNPTGVIQDAPFQFFGVMNFKICVYIS